MKKTFWVIWTSQTCGKKIWIAYIFLFSIFTKLTQRFPDDSHIFLFRLTLSVLNISCVWNCLTNSITCVNPPMSCEQRRTQIRSKVSLDLVELDLWSSKFIKKFTYIICAIFINQCSIHIQAMLHCFIVWYILFCFKRILYKLIATMVKCLLIINWKL